MTLPKTKLEIKKKIKNICSTKKAYFQAPGDFGRLEDEIKDLSRFAQIEFNKEYARVRDAYGKRTVELRTAIRKMQR